MFNGEEFLENEVNVDETVVENAAVDVNEEDPSFLENGFIVDVTDAKKISDVIYQLSTVLDLPDAQEKQICIKLGDIDLTATQLSSIRALVETMNSTVAFISTTSDVTESAAYEVGMKVSKLENKIVTPDFETNKEGSVELEKALDKIFGGVSNEAMKIKERISQLAKAPKTTGIEEDTVVENLLSDDIGADIDINEYEKFNKELEEANNISAEEEERLKKELQAKLQLTEKLPTLYIQRTLRSGQSLTADGNVVIIGDVNPGSEIKAVGDITVWGVLGGIAHAGIEGNQFAKIRALKMNAIQIRIAEVFARRPDSANIPYIQKTDTYVPEEASVEGNHIIIQKIINR